MKPNVLIVGSGAREHALAWALRRSPDLGGLYVAPGNAGTPLLAENVPLATTDLAGIVRFAEERDSAVTVIGPEAPLALGLADRLRAVGRRVVGPSAAAARIECSKSFGKELMARAGVPTAAYRVFDRPDAAWRYLDDAYYPLVIKADGLAAGKGVAICRDAPEGRAAIQALMLDRVHGKAGRRVVVEEALSGPEVSLLALVDGERVAPLPVAQDHKRLGDGDTGPNTGGMGAYAPVSFLSVSERDALVKLALEPVVAALADLGTPFQGVLYAGLMLTEAGPRVLEYNCRLGDPEAQVILPLLVDDVLPWLEAVADGDLSRCGSRHPRVVQGSAVGVVLAAPGYPEHPEVGIPLRGLDAVPGDVLVFHAGTALDRSGQIVTAGGRVATVVGAGATVERAACRAYAAPVWFEGMQRRGDIAWQGRTPHPLASSPTRGRGGVPIATVGAAFMGALPSPAVRERGLGGEGKRLGVLVSGDGSNLQSLLDACESEAVGAEVVVVISNKAEARALERARRAGVPALALTLQDRRDPVVRRRYEDQLLELLRPFQLDLLVLAGWMLILSEDFLVRCPCPVINLHPALLPLNGSGVDLEIPVLRGAHAVRDALALGIPYTGVSVHYVTPEVDAGPVVLREPVRIEPGDDEDSLYRRIKAVEHRLLPRAVQAVLSSIHDPGGAYA